MKRMISFMLALLMLCICAAAPAYAAEELTYVHCDEQSFSLRIPADKTAYWEENVGMCVSVGAPGYVPYVSVFRRPEKLKNPVNYLNNVYREYMEGRYNNNVGTNPCANYDIGGKTLYAANYHYEANGNKLVLTLMIETRDDGDVEYIAKYQEGKAEAALAVLDTVVRYYQPDEAETAQEKTAELVDIHCAEQGYSTKMPAGLSTSWQEDNGLRIWGDEPGYVPNVQVWRRETKLNDPETYVREKYTDYMKETYGDRLVGIVLHDGYVAGGKQLLGASYVYKGSSGASINQVHLVELRDDGDVEYNARFLNDEREATLEILDAAVRYYQPDATSSAPQNVTDVKADAKALNAVSAQPIAQQTIQYSDGRFSMKLPEGWQMMTQSEYMSFCFKSWDPSNPNRTIFMFMKLEPFLKSWAAKEAYQQVNSSLGGNILYALSADAPVMESCSLQGFLDSIPQLYDFCGKYFDSGLTISPSVLPQMKNVTIVEKMPSALPAPDTCAENVIGRIAFEDYLGQRCEGLVTAQPLNTMQYDFFGVDGWPYTVYLFMGVTAPMGEMQELEATLTECLGSFAFTQNYVNQAVGISNSETQALLAQGRTMQAAHDAMTEAWYAREKSHDIAFQKWSDSFMGYDRLYDSVTGEVYLADIGFYDSYDLHRGEYSNANLQIVDGSSEQYYLQGADYYITK